MPFDYDPLRNALKKMHAQMGHGTWARIGRAAGLSPAAVSIIANKNNPVDNESWNKLYAAYPDTVPAPPWRRSTEKTVLTWLEGVTADLIRDLKPALEKTSFPVFYRSVLAAAASLGKTLDQEELEARLKAEYRAIEPELPPPETWSHAVKALWPLLSGRSPWPQPAPIQTKAFIALVEVLEAFPAGSVDLDNLYNYIRGWLAKNENESEPFYDLLEKNLQALGRVFADGALAKDGVRGQTKIPGLGFRLKQARRQAGLSKDQTAEALDVPPAQIDAWENGRSDPPIEGLLKITRLYKTDAHYLLSGKQASAGLANAVLSTIKSEPGRQWTAAEITDAINDLIKSGRLKIQA